MPSVCSGISAEYVLFSIIASADILGSAKSLRLTGSSVIFDLSFDSRPLLLSIAGSKVRSAVELPFEDSVISALNKLSSADN